MRITQCKFSNGISFFKPGFFWKWNLSEYSDNNEPALFVGMYNQQDIQAINNHKGFKLVLFGGADIQNVTRIKPPFEVVVDEFTYNYKLRQFYSGKIKNLLRVAWKDYSNFKPIPLGEQIYCYQNNVTDGNKKKYYYNELQRVIDYFGISEVLIGYHGNTMPELIERFYSKAFVNIQFNPIAGFTTALEMAFLGRMSISNYPAPFCQPFKNTVDIISYIRKLKNEPRSTNEVHQLAKNFIVTDDYWLNTDFWK